MAETKKDKFYSNREIYEMLMAEKDERIKLTQELALTREYVKKYNGYRERTDLHDERLDELEKIVYGEAEKQKGKFAVGEAITRWGGWIFGLIATGILIAQLF